jgi:hypothetical protein
VAAAAAVAAVAAAAVTLSMQHNGSPGRGTAQAGGRPTGSRTAAHAAVTPPAPTVSDHPQRKTDEPTPATILDDAAAKLDNAPSWKTPDPQDFFYVRTTDATTWTSVSGAQAGEGHAADGTTIWVPGCANGQIVSTGESGSCTLDSVPHYLGDAPTKPSDWDAYLEQMAPGSKAADAQGKIVVQVLHQDLIAPEAAAALLRYTESCSGLHTVAVQPVTDEKLIGVTCDSMTNGSYALVFDTGSHELVGYVTVTGKGEADGRAEIIRQTGVVPAIGHKP